MIPQRVIPRLAYYTDERGPDECWPWLASIGSHGYGQIGWHDDTGRRVMMLAHRAVWIRDNGPIPAGMTIDHECRNRRCVNVAHLSLMTNEENGRRNGNWTKTECLRGHPYDEENTYMDPKGHRRCRKCAALRRHASVAV